ncbi:MAG: protein translocase SEC61 complex subunit gamma [Candidatus Micrarchaeota archaeon]|nr:protein translocase SEC61 complex subunit gamma [Candidatus Micrarchaeota archaeon]
MGIMENLKKFMDNSKHVLSVSYKPTDAEFRKSARLIIFGILLMGALGFVISVIVSLIISGTL